jgi:hypothetical protein
MDLDSGWLPLADAVGRLVARGAPEAEAQVDICAAITKKRLRVRVHFADGDDRGHRDALRDINDIEIPVELNPNRLDWAHSRPVSLYPWRTRSARSGDGWKDRHIRLIEACVEDFVVELLKDISSVRLPDRQSITDYLPISADGIRDFQELARAKWSPCQATVDALGGLPGHETISLSQAVSIMAFGSHAEHAKGSKREDALRMQAGRALCDAAYFSDVVLRGSRAQGAEVKPIPEDYFEIFRCLSSGPNSLQRDYERRIAPSSRVDRIRSSLDDDPMWNSGPFNVEVEVGSFLRWLDREIAVERQGQLHQRRSRRLFDYPFWSIETTLYWIAFRDRNCLETQTNRTSREVDGSVEALPEIRLLSALQRGALLGPEDRQILPASHWKRGTPKNGQVTPESRLTRIDRESVLRTFPERLPCSRAEISSYRQAKIDRIVEKNRKTRKWIRYADIADWCKRSESQSSAGKSSQGDALCRAFLEYAFGPDGNGRLRLLSPDTGVVRLGPEDFHEAAVYPECCWVQREVCRTWIDQHGLSWPARFGDEPTVFTQEHQELKPTRRPGNPSDQMVYLRVFFKRLLSGETDRQVRQESIEIHEIVKTMEQVKHKDEPETIENIIRDFHRMWRENGHKYNKFQKY